MTSEQIRELLSEATSCLATVGTSRERPADKAIIANALKCLAGDAMKLTVRNQIRAEKVILAPGVFAELPVPRKAVGR